MKDEAIFHNPNPINVTFYDMKKIDQVSLVINKLASQVIASKLTDYELTKKLLQKGEADELQLRLDEYNMVCQMMMTMTVKNLGVGMEVVGC